MLYMEKDEEKDEKGDKKKNEKKSDTAPYTLLTVNGNLKHSLYYI